MDFLLSSLINVCFAGFVLVMAFDLSSGLRELWVKSAPPRSRKGIYGTYTLGKKGTAIVNTPGGKGLHEIQIPDEMGGKFFSSLSRNQQTLTLSEIEDPWLAPMEVTEPCCCTAIAAPVQLLLSPALEVAEQPDIAGLSSGELRKLCQSAGIPWRNSHGKNKHLSKNEMVAALSH